MARFIALNSIMIKSISVQELLLTLSQYIRCNYNQYHPGVKSPPAVPYIPFKKN